MSRENGKGGMTRGSDGWDLGVFTIVQDEPEFIHPWLNHYRKHAAEARDLFVLAHAPSRSDGTPIPSDEMVEWGEPRR